VSRINSTKIAFIGFGEVGQRFASDLTKRDDVVLSAFDIAFGNAGRGADLEAAATKLGVGRLASAADAGTSADIVVSAVTADQTEAVAQQAAGWLRAGQVFVDVNSASPMTKQRAAACITPSGADYLEAAVMAPVRAPGIRVPILAGGPAAAALADRLNALGMNVTPVATTFGRASAIKLCRSIVIKGLEALMVDCSAATKHFGVEAEVYASLGASYPSIDWQKLADDMSERVATHGVRRAAEMREASDMVAEIGRDAGLLRAVADAQERGAKKKP
jgi:3-hydroxyisobutyrate dehydrogenase-like beta-hydroxyacid dehydrogenase